MKTIIKDALKELIVDRYLLVLVVLNLFLGLGLAIAIGLSIRPSELQLVTHYTAFGVTHLYRDQWYYLLVFVLFQLVVATLHSVLSVKLLLTKGHSLAVMFAWFGIGILLMGGITASAVLNVWTPL